ncbi:MAG: prepilin-type N-terminal cleavage/methylation domain-containing protein [Candidatus Nealsonbacteria bacterium]|nr:prepilin-type N-terminal cleavage/methylation domain-containing protein [Candidatus Nealsonbacteria bacterium]
MTDTKNKSSGFTLTEMIVVSAIFCILIVVIYSVYLFQQRAYVSGESSAEIIQNGRVVSERMTRELRQAKKIISALPAEEIRFQDGHLAVVKESSNAQGGAENTITLALSASSLNDYYKDLYIKIASGTGAGQVKKIYSYDGVSKVADIEGQWSLSPDVSSVYAIDSSYYYIYYYKNAENQILRKVYACCLSSGGVSCEQPEAYIDCTSIPPEGFQNMEVILEEPRVIGEYVTAFNFSGSPTISVSIELQKDGKVFNLVNKVFGRNL